MGYGALPGLFLIAVMGLIGCASQKVDSAADTQSAKSLFEEKCSFCHGLNVALKESHTQEGWRKLVSREAGRKIWHINSAEQEVISQYLFKISPAEQEPPPKPEVKGVESYGIPENVEGR